ncbi:MAG: hypothetical protein ACRDKZ_09235 [Actinomycetota bacterium]
MIRNRHFVGVLVACAIVGTLLRAGTEREALAPFVMGVLVAVANYLLLLRTEMFAPAGKVDESRILDLLGAALLATFLFSFFSSHVLVFGYIVGAGALLLWRLTRTPDAEPDNRPV